MSDQPDLSCPVPFSRYQHVVLAHGGGGRVMRRLVEQLFVRAFDTAELREAHDGAVVELSGPTALSTDSFTVRPLFFPGGNIGSLAVHGTVNDIAACGAVPVAMTASFILEEGLSLSVLDRVVRSMADAAREAGIRVVAGDTKVVERGKGDGVFIATTGVGPVISRSPVRPDRVVPGDAVIVSGPVGDHGIAVMLAREEMGLTGEVASDSASIAPATTALIEEGIDVHCLRDATRGGLATVLAEVAETAGVCVRVSEDLIPVREAVSDACELLGFDPLYVACEGRFVAFVPGAQAARAVNTLRNIGVSADAARIGEVAEGPQESAVLVGSLGAERVLDLLSGEQLPRIC